MWFNKDLLLVSKKVFIVCNFKNTLCTVITVVKELHFFSFFKGYFLRGKLHLNLLYRHIEAYQSDKCRKTQLKGVGTINDVADRK